MTNDTINTISGACEIHKPDKDVIELTNKILDQHEKIIEANIMLLKLLNNPIIMCQEKTFSIGG